MAFLTLALLTLTLGLVHALLPPCEQGVNCLLPNCSCPTFTFSHPTMTVKDIPQLVYFGFDDAVTVVAETYYHRLFGRSRINPNGCKATISLYVQHQYTDYKLINHHYVNGDEIGSHSVTHTNVKTYQQVKSEAGVQKENLHQHGGVPNDEVVGWRSPNLVPAGDDQPRALKKLGYTYDISLTYTRAKISDPLAWPYTLNYGYPYRCGVPECPSLNVSHPGFWEMPINLLFDPQRGIPCVYVDACRPDNRAAALKFLKTNFDLNYNGGRAPFGLNMHAAWFYTPAYLEAMEDFLTYILSKGDVYVVSVNKVLDWMRNPLSIAEAKTSQWGCPPPSLTPTPDPTQLSPSPSPPAVNPATVTSSATPRHPAVVTSHVPPRAQSCLQGVNCHLPTCQCRSLSPPAGLTPKETPQIVYLTFIGGTYAYPAIRELLTNIRNSDGCPVRATFFVPLRGNDQSSLRSMRNAGHEIAMFGSASAPSGSNVEEQLAAELIAFQSLNSTDGLTARAGAINQGYRSTVVNTLGKNLFTVLNASDVIYDASLVTPRTASQGAEPWPYTLDFGWHEPCSGGVQCPSEMDSYPGLWEVPIVPLVDYKQQFVCTYADACFNRPSTEEDTFQMFMQHFNVTLNTNRAPMGIHLRREWFSHSIYLPNLLGLVKFLNHVTSRDDAFVTSVEKMLDWMRNPTRLDQIVSFDSWKC